jgi:glycosyltransferase involved in cell wall biosynthesis
MGMSSFTPPRRVSVIVPTRDRPAMLRQALASIRALEGPDISFEILVGDNGQDSQTRNVAEEFGAVYIPVLTKGAGAARNAGLRAATGEFIAFLDDDDVWLPDHIRPQIVMLDSRADLDAVISKAQSTDSNLIAFDEPWPISDPGVGTALLKKMLGGFFPQIAGLVIKRKVLAHYGEFDNRLLGGQDLDWMLRIARASKLGFCETVAVLFRQRPNGSFDALQRRRVGFDRRVFLRHAVPDWHIWASLREFHNAYYSTLFHFYSYFEDAALERAQRGETTSALSAVLSAFFVFPLRAATHLVLSRKLRRATLLALMPAKIASAER